MPAVNMSNAQGLMYQEHSPAPNNHDYSINEFYPVQKLDKQVLLPSVPCCSVQLLSPMIQRGCEPSSLTAFPLKALT
jgi:hypothetical protein